MFWENRQKVILQLLISFIISLMHKLPDSISLSSSTSRRIATISPAVYGRWTYTAQTMLSLFCLLITEDCSLIISMKIVAWKFVRWNAYASTNQHESLRTDRLIIYYVWNCLHSVSFRNCNWQNVEWEKCSKELNRIQVFRGCDDEMHSAFSLRCVEAFSRKV